ncbi:hypothetical protein KW801_01390 [Candidatus Saccharibacteria bacterium]|nr:hypothetical protein [Candidatus Saccharibacteria bacterium]
MPPLETEDMSKTKTKLSKKDLLKHASSLSRAHLLVVVAVFGLVGGYFLYRSFAASPLVASLEAEQMILPTGGSVVTDTGASAGKAILLSTNGTATGSVNFPSQVTSLTVVAKGSQCQGAPTMSVSLDGASLLSGTAVSTTTWTSYSATPSNPINSGTHNLSISFANDYTKNKGNPRNQCSRALYLDVTSFYGPTPAPIPAPTVTLSASPTSVTAGQASTLTWNSTNATSCTASGAWSGPQPTAGSTSTGALNQNSSYTLTCTGAGGAASASATVTVTTPPPPPPPPPSSSGILTGAHWPSTTDFSTIKNVGYGFAVETFNPGDSAGLKAKLDAADANGLKLIIGMYPEPYSMDSSGNWTISAAGIQSLNQLAARSSSVLALFVYNEPLYISPLTGASDSCGAMSAAQLRGLRTKIQSVWAGAKIYHDLGQPAQWAPGGTLYNSYPCIGSKYADFSGVADYVGVWDYPFKSTGYQKTQALASLSRESSYVINSMRAIPVWLDQGHSGVEGLVWPTQAQILDWNCSSRAALPAGSLISWYVWEQSIYPDYLKKHPEMWSSTTASAC